VIADLGVNFVERQVLLAGFTVERMAHDYGIDLILFTYDRQGEIEWGEVFLQVKATDHLQVMAKGATVAIRIERAHMRYWVKESTPIILIVYDAQKDAAYWLYIQAYFEARPKLVWETQGGELIVHIPKHQVLDSAAMTRFAEFRDRVLQQRDKGVTHEE
jgi:hypothetical protein